ncbi:sensor histidine kinase [Amycolatopsis sp. NPDC049868]|uniref:sensor histidine kinase n=1 Tax=Amycolatopsis sp. NPDC049868 TaxID=3363934 RepID=UPI0037B9DE3B
MRGLVKWAADAGTGFWRAAALTAVSMVVPAMWAAAVWLMIAWGSPWAATAPALWAVVATFLLARPICWTFRFFRRSWTGVVVPGGYREPVPAVQMSTGYWWNGSSYAKSRREAEKDQRLRMLWSDPATWRDLRFVWIAPFTAGIVAAVPLAGVACLVWGILDPGLASILLAGVGLVAAVGAAPYAWRVIAPVTDRFLRGSPAMILADRVDELTAQRADTTVAQAAEISRIERDLHDGAQARLVGLGLSLATAEKLMETDPESARALLRDARAGAAASLSELRELVRGIRPAVLNERGLTDAVRAFALDSPLETTVSTDVQLSLDAPIESALYFGVAELLTNAAKHASATKATVLIARDSTSIAIEVEDDGKGGANEQNGGGLAGLRRRLAVFDGDLKITSPVGGPTRVRMSVPCE